MTKVSAFSLIELMIVITIIGILAAVAVPAYQDYTMRAKVAEAFVFANKVQLEIEEFYQINGRFPANVGEVNYTSSGNTSTHVNKIYFYGCAETNVDRFMIDFNASSGITVGNQIAWRGVADSNGVITWTCRQGGSPLIPLKYLPGNCVGFADIDTASGVTCTNIGNPTT